MTAEGLAAGAVLIIYKRLTGTGLGGVRLAARVRRVTGMLACGELTADIGLASGLGARVGPVAGVGLSSRGLTGSGRLPAHVRLAMGMRLTAEIGLGARMRPTGMSLTAERGLARRVGPAARRRLGCGERRAAWVRAGAGVRLPGGWLAARMGLTAEGRSATLVWLADVTSLTVRTGLARMPTLTRITRTTHVGPAGMPSLSRRIG